MRLFALVATVSLTLLSLSSAAGASAGSPVAVSARAVATRYAAGSDAVFFVTARGDDPSGLWLDFSAEGGQLTGAVALNETGPGVAEGVAFVRRESPGTATLTLSVGGSEVARASAEFVEGAPLTVDVRLAADSTAAARTWYFDVINSDGVNVAFLQPGTSGDSPSALVATQPLPFGRYLVRPALGHDTAETCDSSGFYAIAPASGVEVDVAPDGGAARFVVEACPDVPRDLQLSGDEDPVADAAPEQGSVDQVAGVRAPTPLPPATGNGDVERPTLSETHAHQLVGLLIATLLMFGIGVVVVRLLARFAPVRPKK